MAQILIYAFSIGLTLLIPVIYYRNYKRKVRIAREKLQRATTLGLTEPISLHPKIDPNRCIGVGGCVKACPEGEILGIIDGRAELVSPSKCIGHGACQLACPVDAISLVFGTERRGVEIPYVKPNFETNVEGIFIAGELGGMGLIRNAITQGAEAIDYIAESLRDRDPGMFDVAIIGAGPAGIAATLEAEKHGLRYLTLEQDDIGGTVLSYPRQKLVMTQPMDIPLWGKFKRRAITKEELIELWMEILQKTGVDIRTFEKVQDIDREDGAYQIISSKGEYLARRVLLAIGRRGTPRKLGVPGERSPKVAYKLIEPEQYQRKKVLVVGGGDSAVEAALSLADQPGTDVTLSYRRAAFTRIREENYDRIHEAMSRDRVHVLYESRVLEIQPTSVLIEKQGTEFVIDNDYVFVFIGGELPFQFLQRIGIQIEMKYGER
ncbi:MAG: NAD(P)-binding domain-containing protein [candidate division KSB1 bacterium]|nr:NAD(P)-binding domain-containing protein [candidate division KSB1 bacterium]MDQ7066395.1 NAD(P)-binding domain-containing protein [candidate division KSB1 bacterium]